ncbi:MAG: nicotinate-nucleotide adenylyltransferase [Proteobacteria bacterium]|nr:nicotinate-nucleotide adenylyltransferase [Pseudomonadota bacterium]
MRIGIFGGTFDPVHIGHLRVVEEVREFFFLERVYFVPVYIPPHKRNQRITSADERLKMLSMAIRGNNALYLSEMEIKRGGVSYSIDTIRSFEKKYKDLYFIIGIDAFSEIDTWHRYEEIFHHTNFIIMIRPTHKQVSGIEMFPMNVRGDVKRVGEYTFEHISGKRIYVHNITQFDISSTKIRESLKKEKSIRYLVPYTVERFIHKRRLYRV